MQEETPMRIREAVISKSVEAVNSISSVEEGRSTKRARIQEEVRVRM
jgi:hypothetical protein